MSEKEISISEFGKIKQAPFPHWPHFCSTFGWLPTVHQPWRWWMPPCWGCRCVTEEHDTAWDILCRHLLETLETIVSFDLKALWDRCQRGMFIFYAILEMLKWRSRELFISPSKMHCNTALLIEKYARKLDPLAKLRRREKDAFCWSVEGLWTCSLTMRRGRRCQECMLQIFWLVNANCKFCPNLLRVLQFRNGWVIAWVDCGSKE